jgi:hypothetical protein
VWRNVIEEEIMFEKFFLRRHSACFALLFVNGLFIENTFACSSCGCTLNSDWSSQGYSVSSGLRVDLREDYYDQSQLRSGTQAVDRNSLDIPNEQEVQQDTLNRNTILGVDFSPSRSWGLHFGVPYFNRYHTTIGEGDSEISTSHTKGIGDVRITARYQGFSSDLSWGVQMGVKLPTGKTDEQFIAGPLTGEIIDRGLQHGTGTTDVLIGAYHFGNLSGHIGYFAQATIQSALNEHQDFKPGDALNLNLGLRYLMAGRWSPQLQVNGRFEGRESGSESDRDNSGATMWYLSPGASFQLTRDLQIYGFMQFPVYQRANGLQIQPTRFYSLGVQYKL